MQFSAPSGSLLPLYLSYHGKTRPSPGKKSSAKKNSSIIIGMSVCVRIGAKQSQEKTIFLFLEEDKDTKCDVMWSLLIN